MALTVAIATVSLTTTAKADTVQARCDVFPKGDDRAKSSGLCTFSQRQGNVGIQLKDGTRYDLTPVGNKPNTYRDQKGRSALRESGLGDRGQIYRLTSESIFVYWDAAPYDQQGSSTMSTSVKGTSAKGTSAKSSSMKGNSSVAAAQPLMGKPVSRLSDLVGARAGQAENTVIQRGYRFVKNAPASNAVYSYWIEGKTNNCVAALTKDGRYQSFVYTNAAKDCRK
ncbi:MAG: hypothetical protein MH252_18230 [Thermosynechococcaceae cyanobacterium MS004]|nr:hypothetical protein [Thermosynechococcaceae cyanobacterium MS004]